MFENCKTLAELNQERSRIASLGETDTVALNNSYNDMRKRILSDTSNYKRLAFFEYKPREFPKVSEIPFGGVCAPECTIMLTSGGFLI